MNVNQHTTLLNLNCVSKNFKQHDVLKPLSFSVQDGEFLTLLGPSGCGKTTLLRLIAGLESVDSGSIFLKKDDITRIPAEKRHIHMVFQNYALFPHMTVSENVGFGLRCQKLPKKCIQEKVSAILDCVKLTHLKDRKPAQLSGGQQQRVAIARAVVNEPLLLLLDEPFSALDVHLRKHMRLALKVLQRQLGITFILVTHDQEEALILSDRIIVMNEGRIEQIGNPRDLYEEPNNLFVAKFIGEANIFESCVHECIGSDIKVFIGENFFILKNKKNFKKNDPIVIVIRPEDIEIVQTLNENTIHGLIVDVIYKGSTMDLIIEIDIKSTITVTAFFDEGDENLNFCTGDSVFLNWKIGWESVFLKTKNDEIHDAVDS